MLSLLNLNKHKLSKKNMSSTCLKKLFKGFLYSIKLIEKSKAYGNG